ncbi:cell division ATP-binding protein FtsE [Candidatus Shapirobacteria bacterium CG09_land_8_20_14_0_10_39_12]|uniref:Cell division ATP-binding protein FtsE n=1 Tax=Candidatus Shapirobacteria bacterium CG09_land_8_20_14_0_10_39_12 TaxID=1974885 RepID=A0A2H0WRT1_9BACT|nr:MAG: cell division ATP-binding protein FtsE [Candidatus Shapirobacteria bacterium CG09_land_8_20_14_0_10_39_12]
MISFNKVTKKFGEITALENVSFKIDKGEFVFLTGPSGAGKTTIVKILLGEYLPSSGTVEVNGEEVNKIPKRKLFLWRRKLGVIFQDYKLFSDRTVEENVSLPLLIQKKSASEIKHSVDKILSLVGLTERAKLFPPQLAGGELQRTALARALITAPEILIADEPTGNLDPQTSAEMMKLFKEINEKGTTLLMATHNKTIVDSFKTRVIELKKGQVVRDEKEGKYHKN